MDRLAIDFRLGVGPCLLLALATFSASPLALAQDNPISATADASDAKTVLEDDLKRIFAGERTPKTLDDLRRMERRQQQLAQRLIPCTIGVRVGQAQGSGVLISADGYVLTAAHVAQVPDRRAEIRLHDGQRVYGVTLGMNREIDAGLIKIESPPPTGKTWPFAPMGRSSRVRPGQWCVVTGHPGGYQAGRNPVFRVGRVLDRDATVIRTDCPLIGGDSGGPLFDMDGRVIGINSRIGPPLTVNLHVPVGAYDKEWETLARGDITGGVARGNPFIGVRSDTDEGGGALLSVVRRGQPAYEAGLRNGDVIVKFGNATIATNQDLVKRVAGSRPGSTVNVVIRRGMETRQVKLEIGVR